MLGLGLDFVRVRPLADGAFTESGDTLQLMPLFRGYPPVIGEEVYGVPTLKGSLHPSAPWDWARDNHNWTYLVNGTDRPQIWDGLASATRNFGITAPTEAPTTALGAAGNLTGDYYYYFSWLNNNTGVWSSPGAVSTVLAATSDRIEISAIPGSNSDSQVTHWRLWRNTAGQQTTFYKVADITIGTTTYTDNITDATITANVIMEDDNDPPPSTLPYIAYHKDRMHLYGSRIESTGTVTMTNGSASVSGSGTYFKASHVGQKFVIPGDTVAYTISAVGSTTDLTLSSTYQGSNGSKSFKIYTEDYALWMWSKAGEYEYFPAANSSDIFEGDADDPTGLFAIGSILVAAKRRHLYRIIYEDDPTTGGVFEALSHRGLVNDRCAVVVGHDAYLLDEQGVYQFDGSEQVLPIDLPIQRLIQPSTEPAADRVNWAYKEKFHGVWDPKRDRILFFVVLGSDTEPKHALVYERKKQRWSLESYRQAVCSSANMRDSNNRLRAWVGDENGCVWGLGIAAGRDGTPPSTSSTVRGTATGATSLTLVDSGASFYTTGDGLTGVAVYIVSGTGLGQTRIIASNTATELTVGTAWTTTPDTTSTYRIGPIPLDIVSRWFPLTDDKGIKKRYERLRVYFQPQTTSYYLGLKFFFDFSSTVYKDWQAVKTEDGLYVPATAGGSSGDGIVYVDMSQTRGYVEVPINNKMAQWLRVEFLMDDTERKPALLGWEIIGWPQPGTGARGG